MSAAWRFAPSADETPRPRSRRIGEAKGVYDRIRCDFPPHTDAAEDILSIMHGAEGRAPGAPCGGGFLVAPIGVGKSETLRMAELAANEDAVDGERPALRIEISVRGTTDSVPQAILTAFGAKRPDAGKESAQWARATDLMRQHHVRLLLIDEFRSRRRRRAEAPLPRLEGQAARHRQDGQERAGSRAATWRGDDRAGGSGGGRAAVLRQAAPDRTQPLPRPCERRSCVPERRRQTGRRRRGRVRG